jgi:hypothetical protein
LHSDVLGPDIEEDFRDTDGLGHGVAEGLEFVIEDRLDVLVDGGSASRDMSLA